VLLSPLESTKIEVRPSWTKVRHLTLVYTYDTLVDMNKSRRKYYRGKTPCGLCQTGAHYGCRPRLDGQLCSCSCEIAYRDRGEFERKADAALAAGKPVPSIADSLRIFHPTLDKSPDLC
jgi:hypothetical protein